MSRLQSEPESAIRVFPVYKRGGPVIDATRLNVSVELKNGERHERDSEDGVSPRLYSEFRR